MIDDIILSQHLIANLDKRDDTVTFIFGVIADYLSGDNSPLQNGKIEGKLFKRRLERMLEEAIRQKNPTFNHSINVNVEWGLRNPVAGFSCTVYVGISDFDLTVYSLPVVSAPFAWH